MQNDGKCIPGERTEKYSAICVCKGNLEGVHILSLFFQTLLLLLDDLRKRKVH